MKTVDGRQVGAPADVCFHVAADIERWPAILPHYRRVKFLRRDAFATGLVEMAAWRPFGALAWPTSWISEMAHDPVQRTVTYQHVYGITRGMDVLWEVTPVGADGAHIRIVHEWAGPAWPLVGFLAADRVIGPYFVSAIAGRTLAGVAREAERRARLGAGSPEAAPSPPTEEMGR